MYVAEQGYAATDAEAQWNAVRAEWRAECTNDATLGTKEAKAAIGKFLDQHASPEARKALDDTGAGDNPAIVRMLHAAAVKLTEPGMEEGGGGQQAQNVGEGVSYEEFFPVTHEQRRAANK